VSRIHRLFVIAALVAANIAVLAQTQKPAARAVLQGLVQSTGTPIPGATVTATHSTTNQQAVTSTDLNGRYQLRLPEMGNYNVEVTMPAFATAAKSAVAADASLPTRLDFDLVLASRTQQASAQRGRTVGLRGRGAQTLKVQQTAAATGAPDEEPDELTAQLPAELQVPGLPRRLLPRQLRLSATMQRQRSGTISISIANRFSSSSINSSASEVNVVSAAEALLFLAHGAMVVRGVAGAAEAVALRSAGAAAALVPRVPAATFLTRLPIPRSTRPRIR